MSKISLFDSIDKTVTKNRLSKEGENDSRVITSTLDKNLRFENGKIFYKDVLCGSYDDSERKIYLDQEKCLNEQGLNVITTHASLPKDAIIEVADGKNKHIIETDELGRKTKVTNHFKEKKVTPFNKKRTNNEQTKAKMFGDEDGFVDTHFKNKDQGGHCTAASAGSLQEMAYIFSQAYQVNNSKEWRVIEDDQRIEMNREIVDFTTTTEFEYEGDSKRPKTIKSSIKSKYINKSTKFNNSNLDSVPVLAENQEKYMQPEEEFSATANEHAIKPSKAVNKGLTPENTLNLESLSIADGSSKYSIKGILATVAIVVVFLTFLWLSDNFPFVDKDRETKVVKNTELVKSSNVDIVDNSVNEDLLDSKLLFSRPLEDLTTSITDILEFNSLIESQKVIPVVGSMFDYNSTEITVEGKKILAAFASSYRRVEIPNKILIEGFTCNLGTKTYNHKLGEERAFNIKKELVDLGISDNIIIIKPIGLERFVSTNNINNDQILNRRSNVTIISSK